MTLVGYPSYKAAVRCKEGGEFNEWGSQEPVLAADML